MAAAGTFNSVLGVLREVDVRPLRTAAEATFFIPFFSRDLPLAQHLVGLLYSGIRQQDIPSSRVCGAFLLNASQPPRHMNAAVIITRADGDNTEELRQLHELEQDGIRALVCLLGDSSESIPLRDQWLPANQVVLNAPGGVLDDDQARHQLINAIRDLKVVDELSLARHLPAFRESASRSFISDTAVANAVYSFGSGVLESNPVADIPLNVADIVILTKNQALMAYKIALAMGLSSDFRQVMPQLAAVVGGGFLLRQTARGLVGLVPGFGLVPKVAVAFAGTYATGEIIHRWCAYGERVNKMTVRELYASALTSGRTFARTLLRRHNRQSPEV